MDKKLRVAITKKPSLAIIIRPQNLNFHVMVPIQVKPSGSAFAISGLQECGKQETYSETQENSFPSCPFSHCFSILNTAFSLIQ